MTIVIAGNNLYYLLYRVRRSTTYYTEFVVVFRVRRVIFINTIRILFSPVILVSTSKYMYKVFENKCIDTDIPKHNIS